MTEHEFEMAQRLEESARLAGIEAARRASATKGTPDCVDCEAPISAKRRAAVPHAQRCAECQTIIEKARKHGR
ncbi:TraR/DksA family transcriptional regulator [Herbaspirillum lusitanum]|uniref:TraR/DksA family transcriptional regulator n=1 Tax=Herbaspirillum lusitanum TaxID=213312 RepID=UPI002238182C|nr:TraR/DksA C4-type zinc finger protein [Herbaspirillum lusitanum]